MPETKTLRRAEADKRAGKSASTQAGEFVKEEVESVRGGKHGVRSAKQAIAIGLSKARREGIALKPPGVKTPARRPAKRLKRTQRPARRPQQSQPATALRKRRRRPERPLAPSRRRGD